MGCGQRDHRNGAKVLLGHMHTHGGVGIKQIVGGLEGVGDGGPGGGLVGGRCGKAATDRAEGIFGHGKAT